MTRIFHEILRMSLSAGFLVAVVIALRWCFRRSPKWVHCILWALVAVRLICPSLPQSHFSMVPEQVSEGQVIVQMVEEMPPFVPAPPIQETPQPVPEAPEIQDAPDFTPAGEGDAQPSIPWMTILTGVWLAGMALMGLYAVFSYIRILKKVGPCVDAGEGIFLCDYIDTPFLLGFRRPRIYLPSYLNDTTAAYVLAHERAHIARRDHWWKPIGFVLLSIHWFNPMIWVGYCLLCRDIEMACDEAVVKTMGNEDKKGYSHALLSCSLPRRTVSICPLAFGEVSVKERIKSVLNYRKPALWLTALGIAAVVFGAVFFLTDPKENVPPEDVEYFPTAVYAADRDELVLMEYDEEYRPKRTIVYRKGSENYREEYSYKRSGDHLTRTMTRTSGPDAVTLLHQVYEEKLNENGDPVESILTTDGNWESTTTYTYDEQGNLLTEVRDELESISKLGEHRTLTYAYTYDALGNLLTKRNVCESPVRDTSSYESKYQRDEEGNVLQYQHYLDDRLVVNDQYILDENGKTISRVCNHSDGSVTTYAISRNEADLSEIIYQTGADGDHTSVAFYDERENHLATYDMDENGTCVLTSARNFIGTDGFRSNGIPEEIYKEGQPITAHPDPHTISMPAPEQISTDPGAPYEPLSAKSVLLYDRETNTVICSYEPDTRLAPGNLAKIVTVSLALESCGPDETVTITGPISSHIAQLPGGPNQKLQREEQFTVRDLSAMMLLQGANDAAVAVAQHVAGDQGAFVDRMNLWVREIGCTDTKFANVHGLTDEESHTTARDLVRILNAAVKNSTFRELFSTKYHKVPATSQSEARELYTQNYMMDMRTIPDFYDDRITGGMQAYAPTIGANLICTVEDRYIAVVLGAQREFAENGWQALSYGNFEEMEALLDQGIAWEPVTFYPSASYDEATETLMIFEYDGEFRRTKTTQYEHGVQTKLTQYAYRQEGDTLVKTVTDEETIFVDAGGEIRPSPNKDTHVMEYHDRMDSDGNVIESDRYIDGEYSHSTRYTYDENGVVSWEYLNPDGRKQKTVNTYDDKGNLIRHAEYSVGGETKQPAFEERCTYDENGNVLQRDRYYDGILENSDLFTYDDQGRVLMETAYYLGKHIRTYTHTYARRTETLSETTPDGTVKSTQRMRYDAHENLLTTTTVEGDLRHTTYTNYIGTNGTQIISIPTEFYSIASGEWAGFPDGIRFEEYSGDTYTAHVMIVRDPSQVYLGVSSPDGFSRDIPGKRIGEIMESEGALAAVNAGAFFDDGTASAQVGSTPEGLVYASGECVWETGDPPHNTGFAGFNRDNVLIVKNETISKDQAEALNIRDGCCYGPALIMGGEVNVEARDQNNGLNPRTAIGQRADGAVIFVCIDGRQANSVGGTYADLIDIMTEYGAVNACNMGGGSSSVMMHRDTYGIFGEAGKLNMMNSYSLLQSEPRRMPTYWMVGPSR